MSEYVAVGASSPLLFSQSAYKRSSIGIMRGDERHKISRGIIREDKRHKISRHKVRASESAPSATAQVVGVGRRAAAGDGGKAPRQLAAAVGGGMAHQPASPLTDENGAADRPNMPPAMAAASPAAASGGGK